MSTDTKQTRCAVYTRKSTEHNLDLEFNSLDAQREACEAYIKSQVHEGWRLVPDRYDDGGISGASLGRPDLQRLLADIRAGRVDTVVVYKVDRLTRSLTDFAKLVELFDAYGVSFVSVTQSFNTTTSMGRLTLNVLLSFAQFEREVIGERVRDKIAASKRKGLWMGGSPPLGYVNQGKRLVVVPDEAETVRWIFRRYLELGSLGALLEELRRAGIKTKVQKPVSGSDKGGIAFRRGALAYLLKNRCYIGELFHKGMVHVADHEPILDRETFEAVQARLAANKISRTARIRASPFLLTGLIFDSTGNRMSPVHTSKKSGVRYRYYASQALLQADKSKRGQIMRVPAPDIEALIEKLIQDRLGALEGCSQIGEAIKLHIRRITVLADVVEVELVNDDPSDQSGLGRSGLVTLNWRRNYFRATKGFLHEPAISRLDNVRTQDGLLSAIAKARVWIDEIMAGMTTAEIACREAKSERQIRLLLPLAFTPPAVVTKLMMEEADVPTVSGWARNVPLLWGGSHPPSLLGQTNA